MEGFVRSARRAAMLAMAFGSGGFGVLMIWIMVRPGVISRVATFEMLGVLGLFMLPVLTLAAWYVDHRAVAEQAAAPGDNDGAPGVAVAADPAPGIGSPESPARVPGRRAHAEGDESHVRGAASGRRHRRPSGVAEHA